MPELSFLIDANMPRSTTTVFGSRRYEVHDVRELGMGRATDDEIIEYAKIHDTLIVTRDTDFGSVLRHPNHPGAIILRLPPTTKAQEINQRLGSFLDSVDPKRLPNSIHIVEPNRTRRRTIS